MKFLVKELQTYENSYKHSLFQIAAPIPAIFLSFNDVNSARKLPVLATGKHNNRWKKLTNWHFQKKKKMFMNCLK